jgi:hypothetical protein
MAGRRKIHNPTPLAIRPGDPGAEFRTRVEQEADPVGFLIRVMNGEEIDGQKPDLRSRIAVARFLVSKAHPDLKAVEVGVDVQLVPWPREGEDHYLNKGQLGQLMLRTEEGRRMMIEEAQTEMGRRNLEEALITLLPPEQS